MKLLKDDGALRIYGERSGDVVNMRYEMYDWKALLFEMGTGEVQIDGYDGLVHVKPEHVDATIAADLLAWAKDKAGLSDDDCIIGNNGIKVRLWTNKGTLEHLGAGFPIGEALALIF